MTKQTTHINQLKQPASRTSRDTFPAMLKQFKGEIARALPKHLNPDRMARIALTAFRRTPRLEDCDPRSVFAAVIQAAQLGLEPDTLGRSFLVPYGDECQFIPGWKGLVDLVTRAGQGAVWTGAVFQGDDFDYSLGDSPFVRHRPGNGFEESMITHVYAIGRNNDCKWPIVEVWSVEKARKHRDRYNKVGKRHYSFKHWEMYARKVPLLQVLKYMPTSPELSTAIELSYAAERGSQGLNIDDAIEGTWTPVREGKEAEKAKSRKGAREESPTAEKQTASDKQNADSERQAGLSQTDAQQADSPGEVVDMSEYPEMNLE